MPPQVIFERETGRFDIGTQGRMSCENGAERDLKMLVLKIK